MDCGQLAVSTPCCELRGLGVRRTVRQPQKVLKQGNNSIRAMYLEDGRRKGLRNLWNRSRMAARECRCWSGARVPACPAGVEEQACWALLPGAGDSVRSPAEGVCKWGGPEHGRVRMGMRGGGAGRRQAQRGRCWWPWSPGNRGRGAQSLSRVFTTLQSTLQDPLDCSPSGSSVRGILPGKNTGSGCQFLLQGIFLTRGVNPSLCTGGGFPTAEP